MSRRLPMISVIICCYNGADVLPDCLRAAQKQTYKGRTEIIVVDDGSSDDTYKIAKSFKKVRVVKNEQNKGIAGARNVGLNAAKGEIIAMTDDDCRPQPSWLKELHAAYTDETVRGVGGAAVSKDNGNFVLRYLRAANPLAPLESNLLKSNKLTYRFGLYLKALAGKSEKPANRKRSVYSLVGANMSFRKSLVQEMQFDERFRFGGEEEDLCKRINQKYPGSLWFAPKAKIIHKYDPRLRDTLRRAQAYGKGNARMFYKHADVQPIMYPFPPLLVASLLLGLVNPWLLLSPLLLVQLLYSRWPLTAVKMRKLEPLLYGYVQALQEWYGTVGFVKGFWQFRNMFKKESEKPALKLAKSAKVTAKTTDKSIIQKAKTDKKITFNKAHIFGTAFAGLLIFNAFELTHNALQTAFALAFLAFVPGMLLLASLRISVANLRGVLYAISSSLGLLILTALAANTLILLFPHTFHFSTWLFVGSIDVLCVELLALAWARTPHAVTYAINLSKLAKSAPVAYMLPLPVAGIVGSGLLNHTNNNTLSVITLLAVAALAVAQLVWIKKVRPAFLPFFLYIAGLTIVWMGAARGDFVSGTDISKEFYLFNLAKTVGHWSPSLYHDPYNACLSINLLPILLEKVLKVSDQFIFRTIIPMFYAILPVISYVLVRKYAKRAVAYLAGLFFIMQPIFMSWSAVPIRQMAGFIFFGALILALFDKALSIWQQRALILFFATAMVLSHYSTTYVAIICFVIAYVLQRGEFSLRRLRLKWNAGSFMPIIGLSLIGVLIGIATLWYSPINHSSSNLTHMISSSIDNIRSGKFNLFSGDGHSQQTGLLDQFNPHSKPRTPEQVWQSYLEKTDHKYNGVVVHPLQHQDIAAAITPTAPPHLPEKINHHIASLVALGGEVISKLLRIFVAVGLAIFAVKIFKRSNGEDTNFELFAWAAACMIMLIVVVPYASVDYDLGRTSQQLLLLLALPTFVGGVATIKWLARNKLNALRAKQIVAGIVITYFLFMSGLVGQFTGGGNPVGLLNNTGTQYDQYVHSGEVAAAQWLRQNKNGDNIYAGYFGGNRLWLAGIDKPSFFNDILPWTIDKPSYVFSSFAETTSGNATTYFEGSFVEYAYPNQLLNIQKDLLYNNGQAKIYK